MLTIKRILFPTDQTAHSEWAFSQAVYLADRFDAELHVLHVVVGHRHNPADVLDGCILTEAETATQLHLENPEGAGDCSRRYEIPVVQARVQDVSASVAILDYADLQDIDLIVMATHGRHGVDRLLSGSVAEDVMRLATCPVLTLRSGEEAVRHQAFQRILVPVDFSDHAHGALVYARELARAYDASLDVLHVVEGAVLHHMYGMEPAAVEENELEARVREELTEAIDPDCIGLRDWSVHVRIGHPATEIVRFARQTGADLIVIPTHGRTGLKRLVMGSVAEEVVRSATCPVFTIKGFGKVLVSEASSMSVVSV